MEKIKDFNRTFVAMRRITTISLVGSFVVICFLVLLLEKKTDEAGKKVYVVSTGSTFAAIEQEERKVSVHEARNHVRTFLKLMFSHDAENYTSNVEAALHLIDDKSGKRIYKDFTDGEVLNNYIRYNARTSIEIDSVTTDLSKPPYKGKVYARQYIQYGDQKKMMPLGAQFTLQEISRSDKNPFGLLIKDFDFIQYNPEVQE